MNKTINTLVSIFVGATLLLLFAACSDDDKNDYEVSQEWKDYQADVLSRITKLASTGEDNYKSVKSASEQGSVYYKPSTYITEHMLGEFDGDEPSAFPKVKSVKLTKPEYDTDSVVVRYEGWFYDLNGKRIPFDSTEIEVLTGTSKNNNQKATFAISNVIDGFRTMLKEMTVGDEYIAGFSHQLAYGEYGSTQGSITIPGYSTLFFDIKLLEVKRPKAKE